MKLIRINLKHCEVPQDLLTQRVREQNIDIVIISEPYRVPRNNTWISDKSTTAAIWICGSLPFQEVYKRETGFVMARIKGVFVYSCYGGQWSRSNICWRDWCHMCVWLPPQLTFGRPNGVINILTLGVSASWKLLILFRWRWRMM